MLVYGTSSWTAKGWVGPFYPEGTRPPDYLPYYATQFPAVEADTTYYGVPKPQTVENWAKRTPDGFKMCAKFPKGIVHGGEGPRPDPRVVLEPERVADCVRGPVPGEIDRVVEPIHPAQQAEPPVLFPILIAQPTESGLLLHRTTQPN